MSSGTPPNPWFNAIDYNPNFFATSSSASVSSAYVNANFLRSSTGSNPISYATLTTFLNSVVLGNTTILQTGANLDLYNTAASATMTIRLNNSSSVSQTILSLNTLGTSTFNGTATNASNIVMTSIASGVIYLSGTSGFVNGTAYPEQTDSLGHISFATGTNTLTLGITNTANGNITMGGTTSSLTIPYSTSATAISVPAGTIASQNIVVTAAASNTGLNGLNISQGAFFGRNDTIVNSFSGTLGYTRHPIGWTISGSKTIVAAVSGVTFDIIQNGTPTTLFTTLSNGVWKFGCCINNASSVGAVTALYLFYGAITTGTSLNGSTGAGFSGLYLQQIGSLSNFSFCYPELIAQFTGNGTSNIVINCLISYTVAPILTANFWATKIA